jgi:hypothetical protein
MRTIQQQRKYRTNQPYSLRHEVLKWMMKPRNISFAVIVTTIVYSLHYWNYKSWYLTTTSPLTLLSSSSQLPQQQQQPQQQQSPEPPQQSEQQQQLPKEVIQEADPNNLENDKIHIIFSTGCNAFQDCTY